VVNGIITLRLSGGGNILMNGENPGEKMELLVILLVLVSMVSLF